jgi:hypothetical protein
MRSITLAADRVGSGAPVNQSPGVVSSSVGHTHTYTINCA